MMKMKTQVKIIINGLKKNSLEICYSYPDADFRETYVGFNAGPCKYEDLDTWFREVKMYFLEFERLTGVKPSIFAAPDIF